MESKMLGNLKQKIIEEMTVDYANALEKDFNLAKQLIRITKDGKVDVTVKDKLTGKENILLYLIGKLYAKEAELTATNDVGNQELMDELGIPKGSLFPWLKDLREENKINQVTRGRYTYHAIALNVLEKTLKEIIKKVGKEGKEDVS
jgi:hypothetical protein